MSSSSSIQHHHPLPQITHTSSPSHPSSPTSNNNNNTPLITPSNSISSKSSNLKKQSYLLVSRLKNHGFSDPYSSQLYQAFVINANELAMLILSVCDSSTHDDDEHYDKEEYKELAKEWLVKAERLTGGGGNFGGVLYAAADTNYNYNNNNQYDADEDEDYGDNVGAQISLGPVTVTGLRILTLNNVGVYYKSTNNTKKALTVLQNALALTTTTNANANVKQDYQLISLTHTNICAVLSSMSDHKTALSHAKLAVVNCKKYLHFINTRALSSSASDSDSRNVSNDKKLVNKTLVSLSISLYNLAVETEYTNGIYKALSWYKRAIEVCDLNENVNVNMNDRDDSDRGSGSGSENYDNNDDEEDDDDSNKTNLIRNKIARSYEDALVKYKTLINKNSNANNSVKRSSSVQTFNSNMNMRNTGVSGIRNLTRSNSNSNQFNNNPYGKVRDNVNRNGNNHGVNNSFRFDDVFADYVDGDIGNGEEEDDSDYLLFDDGFVMTGDEDSIAVDYDYLQGDRGSGGGANASTSASTALLISNKHDNSINNNKQRPHSAGVIRKSSSNNELIKTKTYNDSKPNALLPSRARLQTATPSHSMLLSRTTGSDGNLSSLNGIVRNGIGSSKSSNMSSTGTSMSKNVSGEGEVVEYDGGSVDVRMQAQAQAQVQTPPTPPKILPIQITKKASKLAPVAIMPSASTSAASPSTLQTSLQKKIKLMDKLNKEAKQALIDFEVQSRALKLKINFNEEGRDDDVDAGDFLGNGEEKKIDVVEASSPKASENGYNTVILQPPSETSAALPPSSPSSSPTKPIPAKSTATATENTPTSPETAQQQTNPTTLALATTTVPTIHDINWQTAKTRNASNVRKLIIQRDSTLQLAQTKDKELTYLKTKYKRLEDSKLQQDLVRDELIRELKKGVDGRVGEEYGMFVSSQGKLDEYEGVIDDLKAEALKEKLKGAVLGNQVDEIQRKYEDAKLQLSAENNEIKDVKAKLQNANGKKNLQMLVYKEMIGALHKKLDLGRSDYNKLDVAMSVINARNAEMMQVQAKAKLHKRLSVQVRKVENNDNVGWDGAVGESKGDGEGEAGERSETLDGIKSSPLQLWLGDHHIEVGEHEESHSGAVEVEDDEGDEEAAKIERESEMLLSRLNIEALCSEVDALEDEIETLNRYNHENSSSVQDKPIAKEQTNTKANAKETEAGAEVEVEAKPNVYKRGTKVEAQYHGKGFVWYPGKISNCRANGTFDVAYDDGDSDKKLSVGSLRYLPVVLLNAEMEVENEGLKGRVKELGSALEAKVVEGKERNGEIAKMVGEIRKLKDEAGEGKMLKDSLLLQAENYEMKSRGGELAVFALKSQIGELKATIEENKQVKHDTSKSGEADVAELNVRIAFFEAEISELKAKVEDGAKQHKTEIAELNKLAKTKKNEKIKIIEKVNLHAAEVIESKSKLQLALEKISEWEKWHQSSFGSAKGEGGGVPGVMVYDEAEEEGGADEDRLSDAD